MKTLCILVLLVLVTSFVASFEDYAMFENDEFTNSWDEEATSVENFDDEENENVLAISLSQLDALKTSINSHKSLLTKLQTDFAQAQSDVMKTTQAYVAYIIVPSQYETIRVQQGLWAAIAYSQRRSIDIAILKAAMDAAKARVQNLQTEIAATAAKITSLEQEYNQLYAQYQTEQQQAAALPTVDTSNLISTVNSIVSNANNNVQQPTCDPAVQICMP